MVRVLDVDLREEHPQLVAAADLLEALVDVVGVEQVVAHAQEDGAGALADHVVGEDLVVEFPGHAAYRFEDGVASLAGANLHKVLLEVRPHSRSMFFANMITGGSDETHLDDADAGAACLGFARFFFFVALGGPGRRRFRAFHPLRSVFRERGGEDCRAAVRRGAVSLLELLASLLLLESETILQQAMHN